MSDKDFFENGCFSPEWTSDTKEEEVFQQVENGDLQPQTEVENLM